MLLAAIALCGARSAAAQDSEATAEPVVAASPVAVDSPTVEPTALPTEEPESTPTVRPTVVRVRPTATATSTATAEPSPVPASPTPTVAEPTAVPSPTAVPTRTPRPTHTATATATHTATPAAFAAAHLGEWIDLLAGGLLALLAAGLGYGAARLRERGERNRARQTLATAMLSELRWLDAVLRKLVEQGPFSSSEPLDHPIIEAGLKDLTLFAPQTAGRLAHFHTLLRSLRYEMVQLRDNPKPWTGRHAEFDRLLRARAALACRAVPELSKALHREGGTPPPPLADKSAAGPEPSALPPTPFGSGDSDDWTF